MTRSSLLLSCGVAVVVFLVGSSSVVGAQPAQPPTAEEHDKARAFLADGRSKRAAGDHAAALESFQAAHKIEKLSTTGLEVGRTLAALHRLVEARELLSDIAKAPEGTGEPPPLAAARADARVLADDLTRRIPTLAVKLDGTVDASVTATIDGVTVAVDLLGQGKGLDPGDHVVIIRKGRGQETFKVSVLESEKREVTLKVPRDPDQPVVPPIAKKSPPAEDHPPQTPGRSYTIAWVAGAVAVVGIGVGSTTGLLAADKTSTLKPLCPNDSCPPPQYDALRSADRLALASTISFVVAGVAAAVVVWDLVRSPSTAAKTSLRVGPTNVSLTTTF